ncbi:MAG: glycosyltransferase [Candidatus Harrisonbacteria bacterium]|nr:glycosyltransferase [Candidatus Harrisonbacteria bacterium]
MHILFLITKSDTGGAQKYVADLAAELPKASAIRNPQSALSSAYPHKESSSAIRNPQSALSSAYPHSEKFETEIVTGGKGGVRFLSNAFRPYFLFLNDIAAVIEIIFYLRKHHPDILHLNSSKAGVVGAVAAKIYNVGGSAFGVRRQKIKVVFTAHGWVFNPENRYGWLRQRCYILFHKFAAFFQDVIINVSEYDRALALRYHIAPPKKLFTIHNGIDVHAVNFLDRNTARKKLLSLLPTSNFELRTFAPWIGSVGRLVREKDYQTLIDAAALLKCQMSNVKCQMFIVGEGYERAILEKKIAALGLQNSFFLTGAIPDATRYLQAFDVFVMPSIKEGLPYTLLEAMAAGLPIVATKTGGIPEILEPENGIVVPPRDAQVLADAIQKLLGDLSLQKTLGANARAYAEKHLRLETMVEKTAAIYKSTHERL